MHDDYQFPQLEQSIEIEKKVRRSFDPATIACLIEQLRESYRTVAESHDEKLGFNSHTFGYNLYHVNVFNLAKLADRFPDRFTLRSQSPVFRLEIGEYEMGSYRVGKNAMDSIWSSFPRGNGAVKNMVASAYLPGMEQPDLFQAKHIILAHLGNPEDLLCGVYLCIPTSLGDDDRISEWGFVCQIYGDMTIAMPITVEGMAPAEFVQPAVVQRRKNSEVGLNGNAQ